jgi:hypothetical protein
MFLNREILIGLYDSAFEIELDRFWRFGSLSTSGAILSSFEVEYNTTSLLVDWGDGQKQFVGSGIQLSHTFVTDSSGIALLPGGSTAQNKAITLINCGTTNPKLQGTVSLDAFINLKDFTCRNNDITNITGTSKLSALTNINVELNNLVGNIPTLSGNVSLIEFIASFNDLSGFEGGSVSPTIDIFEADYNQLTTDAVDTLLSAFVEANNTTTQTRLLNLGGGLNQAPSANGLTSRSALTAIGWTVITN